MEIERRSVIKRARSRKSLVGGTKSSEDSNGVDLRLDENQALVLFEWLVKFNEEELNQFLDQSEQRVLFDLESQLEKRLSAPFEPNYQELLDRARKAVREGDSTE